MVRELGDAAAYPEVHEHRARAGVPALPPALGVARQLRLEQRGLEVVQVTGADDEVGRQDLAARQLDPGDPVPGSAPWRVGR